jgi:hypothetical protein
MAEHKSAEQKDDVLEELFVDRATVLDQSVLKDMLKDRIQLTKEGSVMPLPQFHTLKRDQRVLLALLAQKVIKIKLGGEEKLTPGAIVAITGMPKGTVAPTVRDLERDGYIRSEKGAYWVPDSLLYKAQQILTPHK